MQGTGCFIIIITAPIVALLVALFTEHGPVMWNLTGLVCGLSIAMVWIRRNDRETKFQKLRAAVIAHVGRPPDHDLRLREAGKQDRLLSVFVPEKKFYVGSGEFDPRTFMARRMCGAGTPTVTRGRPMAEPSSGIPSSWRCATRPIH